MEPKRILILGAGGNSLAIADAIVAINAAAPAQPVYELVGFLDDLAENRGRRVLGFPVVGTLDDAHRWPHCHFINGIASVDSFRKKAGVIARIGAPRERFATIVHPSAVIARDAQVGAGCAIMANSVVCPEARIDDHVIMLQNSSLNHHARLGRFVTVSAGVTLLGCVEAGEGAFVSGGASVAPYVKIGAGALIGLGSTVIRDVAAGSVVAGNPARELAASRYAVKA